MNDSYGWKLLQDEDRKLIFNLIELIYKLLRLITPGVRGADNGTGL
jgi:hypothetical protein